jgi:leader peptidase (prepilin peptidase)/N-methyltransferase
MNILFLSILTDAFFIALLIWCACTDIRTRTVPNTAVVLPLCLGLVHTVLIGLSGSAWWPYPAGLALVIPFFIVWLKGGMGAGDVKLLMGICLYLGLAGTLLSFALMLPMLIACMIHSLRKHKTLRCAIPFAPVLAFGAGTAVIAGYLYPFILL